MTRIEVLQQARAEWVEKSISAKETISEIYTREQQAISDSIAPFFKEFSPEVRVELSRGSVYFKMFDPERGYNKEIFSIYLREDWNGDRSFKGIDLSYYTTSTKGVDAWELKRLQLLGAAAKIILDHQDNILARVNNDVLRFKEEYEVAYQLQNMINTAINDIDVRIRQLVRERVEFDLRHEVVEFTEGRNIDLKYNYSPRVISIRLFEYSKSGKTATAIFQFVGGHTSREEKVNVDKIVDQVAYDYLKYAKDTKRELLPS